jgi:hypothetical protein
MSWQSQAKGLRGMPVTTCWLRTRTPSTAVSQACDLAVMPTCSCNKVMNRDGWVGKSDPFIRICQPHESARGLTYAPVWQSMVFYNNLNPVWENIEVPLGTLCAGDLTAKLIWQVRLGV